MTVCFQAQDNIQTINVHVNTYAFVTEVSIIKEDLTD